MNDQANMDASHARTAGPDVLGVDRAAHLRAHGVRAPVTPAALLGLVVLVSTSSACPASTERCGGPRPPAECSWGLYWADCGGEGDSVFACSEGSGHCVWFVGGCLAVDFRPTDCDASRPCCAARAGGSWPYADGFEPALGIATGEMIEDVAVAGHSVIERAWHGNLGVVVDPAHAFGPPAASCESGSALLCGATLSTPVVTTSASETVLRADFAAGVFTPRLWVVVSTSDPPEARAFYRVGNDVAPRGPTCEEALTPPGVTTGSVILSGPATLGAGLRAEATLTLPDGTLAHLTF